MEEEEVPLQRPPPKQEPAPSFIPVPETEQVPMPRPPTFNEAAELEESRVVTAPKERKFQFYVDPEKEHLKRVKKFVTTQAKGRARALEILRKMEEMETEVDPQAAADAAAKTIKKGTAVYFDQGKYEKEYKDFLINEMMREALKKGNPEKAAQHMENPVKAEDEAKSKLKVKVEAAQDAIRRAGPPSLVTMDDVSGSVDKLYKAYTDLGPVRKGQIRSFFQTAKSYFNGRPMTLFVPGINPKSGAGKALAELRDWLIRNRVATSDKSEVLDKMALRLGI